MVEFKEEKDLKKRILKSWSLCSWQSLCYLGNEDVFEL